MARRIAVPALIATLVFVHSAVAEAIDGQIDAGYGAALVTQTTQTGFNHGQITGDNTLNDLILANGSELDQGYAFISGGVLYLFLTGNLAAKYNANETATVGDVLDLFIDSQANGQNALNGLGTGNPLNGLTLDSGFGADYRLEFEPVLSGGTGSLIVWNAGYGVLATPGGGTFQSLGTAQAGQSGTLSGGVNPYGVLASIDNHNTAGVTFGCNGSSGAGVSTGVEWAIPLAAIGNPSGCIRFTALIRGIGTTNSAMSNQVLASLPVGTCPPGPVGGVNFSSLAGDQFFTICPGGAGVPPLADVRFALYGADHNPTRGDRMRVSFRLPDSRSAELQLVDCAGRVIREMTVGASGSGEGSAELSNGQRVTAGIYWLRLSQGSNNVARKLCVVN
jgi:hypothetical protein